MVSFWIGEGFLKPMSAIAFNISSVNSHSLNSTIFSFSLSIKKAVVIRQLPNTIGIIPLFVINYDFYLNFIGFA